MSNYHMLAFHRRKKNLTQEEAAKLLNISRNTLIMYEKGKLEVPLTVFIKMSELYEFDVFDIFGVNDSSGGNGIEYDANVYYMIKAHAAYVIRSEMEVNRKIYGEEMYSQDYYANRYKKLIEKELSSGIYDACNGIAAEYEKDKMNIPVFVKEE